MNSSKQSVKTKHSNKKKKYDISEIKQIIYNSNFKYYNNYIPEIISKYHYARAINKISELRYF